MKFRKANVKKAIFLIDAAISITYMLLIASLAYSQYLAAEQATFNLKVELKAKQLLLSSFDQIARETTSSSGEVCIIRYVDKKRVVCDEVD